MPAWSRKKPWPGQLEVAGKKYMLRATEQGEMVGRKATRLDAVTPTTYDVSNLKPYVERPYGLGPLTGGMGERIQTSGPARRYRNAIDVDTSIGGIRSRGIALTAATLPGTTIGEIRGFVAGQQGGATIEVFAYGYGGVLRRPSGTETWVLSDNRLAGTPPTGNQGVRFRPQDNTAGDYVYIGYDDDSLRYYDGTVWASAGVGVTIGARFIERNNEELWIWGQASSPGLSKCTSDPRVTTNWSSPFWVGDRAYDVTYLRAIADQLYIFKQDGVYSTVVQALSISTPELFPELRGLAGTRGYLDPALRANGRNAHAWRGMLWFPFLGQSHRMTPGEIADLETTGLSRLTENDSEVKGDLIAFTDDGYFGWYAYYDGTHSYLCKHGTWLNPESDNTAEFVFDEAVHGAVRKLASKKITALDHIPDENGQPRLWVGCSDGSIYHGVLPKNGPDPAQDPACRFLGGGQLYWPDHDAEDPSNLKHWRGFSVDAARVDATDYVQVEYRIPPATSWTPLGTNLITNGQRTNTPGAAVSNTLQVREVMSGSSASAYTTTPEIVSVILHEQTRPALMLEHDVLVIAADNQGRLDGSIDPRSAEQIRAALKLTAGPGPTEIYMPDGTKMDVDFVDYTEAQTPLNSRSGLEWSIPLKLVEFRTL